MKPIDHSFQVLYSELAQRALDAQFSEDFPIEGRFISMESGNRRYWYFDIAKEGGGKRRRYVGPTDDEEITRRVENFKTSKTDARARRKIVSTLIREAYLMPPLQIDGDVIAALAQAGFFRLRGVLVGTVAFQCYSALLGVRLPNSAMQTSDADFAQFHSISLAVEDSLAPMLKVLQQVDKTFAEVPHQADSRFSRQFRNNRGYKVEFLTPNTGSTDYDGRPASMPALGGASAQPLRFLDFLIYQPVRAILLHGSGVPVLVPAPERFAIHKLILASRRHKDNDGTSKSQKDLNQAQTLMEALFELNRGQVLADVYMEAWDRGPSWREAMEKSLRSMGEDIEIRLRKALTKNIIRAKINPENYGL